MGDLGQYVSLFPGFDSNVHLATCPLPAEQMAPGSERCH